MPSKYPAPFFYMESGAGFEKCVGAGVTVADIAARAFRVPPGRVRMIGARPTGRYDFITTLPEGTREALRQELEKQLGFVGRRETNVMDVLVLTVKSPNASGLMPPVSGKPDD